MAAICDCLPDERPGPGGPSTRQALPAEIRANLEAAYGLDRPLPLQFGRYLAGLARGDFGPSFKFRDFTVTELIRGGLPVSLVLGGSALLVALLIGLPAGAWAALRRDRWPDRAIMAVASAGIAVPVFVIAPLLVLGFGIRLGWLPVAGWEPGRYRDLVLPVVALALPVAAQLSRLCRGSLLEVLRAPWIRAARPRGLPAHRIVLAPPLPAPLVPVLRSPGPALAALLSDLWSSRPCSGCPAWGDTWSRAR